MYRFSVEGELVLLIHDLKAPNGVALSPYGKTLYVTDVDNQRAAWLPAGNDRDQCPHLELHLGR